MKDDLISRKAAIDLVRDVCDAIMSCCGSHYDEETKDEVYDDIREVDAILKCNKEIRIALKNMPSAQPAQKTFSVIDNKTGKEADPYEIALNEDWAKNLMYCDMEGFAILEDGSLILVDECGRHGYCPIERFEVRWDEG